MLSFEFVWAFILLPLPIIFYFVIPKLKNNVEIILNSGNNNDNANNSNSIFDENIIYSVNKTKLLLASLSWIFLIIGLANPIFVGNKIKITPPARDIIMALDISNSMKTRDMFLDNKQYSRDFVVKQIASQFVEQRKGDRIGLVLFALNAYLNSPLTLDNKTIATFIKEAKIGIADDEKKFGTAIGDAIAVSVKALEDRTDNEQAVIILLTDGVDTSSSIDPLQATRIAKKQGIKIYTIGIGSENSPLSVSSNVDFKMLQNISKATDGRAFRATNPRELVQIYDIIQRLEPIEKDVIYITPLKQFYYWFVALALLMLCFLFLLVNYEKGFKTFRF